MTAITAAAGRLAERAFARFCLTFWEVYKNGAALAQTLHPSLGLHFRAIA